MTPIQRITELQSRGLCFQCLLPEADGSADKHKEGKCQSDCKRISDSRLPVETHILVCNEHNDESKNQGLFKQYNNRFVTN